VIALLTVILLSIGLAGMVQAQSIGITMEGYRIPTTGGFTVSWTTGNLGKSYDEGEWVPYQTTIDNIQAVYPNMTGMPDIVISWDFSGGGASPPPDAPRFGDLVRDIQVGTTKLTDSQGFPTSNGTAYVINTLADAHVPQNDPDENEWTGWHLMNLPQSQVNIPLPGESDSLTSAERCFVITAQNLTDAGFGSEDTIYIYYQVHESRTFVWNNVFQSGYDASPTDDWGGWAYGDEPFASDQREGSGFVPGSSGHVHNRGLGGSKDVQLPIPPEPEGLIDGHKFEDTDGDGGPMDGEPGVEGWRVHIAGEIESLLFTISTLTDSTGFYEFTGLTAGVWYIAENATRDVPVEDFWSQTYPNSGSPLVAPVATPILSSSIPFVLPFSSGLGGWAYSVALTATDIVQHNVDFGNVARGCLRVCKVLDTSAVIGPLSELPA
jgi:hypothetical protein